MVILSAIVAALTAAMAYIYLFVAGPIAEGSTVAAASIPLYVVLAGILMAVATYLSRGVYTYLRLYVFGYAVTFCLFALGLMGFALKIMPEWANTLQPAPALAVAFAVYSALILLISLIPVVRKTLSLSEPFFNSEEKTTLNVFGKPSLAEGTIGKMFYLLILAVNFVQTYVLILFNENYGAMFDSFEPKNPPKFWATIIVWFVLAVIWVVIAISEYLFRQYLLIRWRRDMSRRMMRSWLDSSVHYRMQLADSGADNPDQRIAEDVRNYVERLEYIGNNVFSNFLNLAAFVVLLWTLSDKMRAPETSALHGITGVSGFLVWICLIYALASTIVGHFIGKKLVDRNFSKEKTEADLRYSLARFREYSEQVALLGGEKREYEIFNLRYDLQVAATYALVRVSRNFTAFRFSLDQLSDRFPYILVAPAYFAGVGSLGIMQQVASAFGRVQSGFSIILNLYDTLADFKASVNRITSFNDAVDQASSSAGQGLKPVLGIADLDIENTNLALPDGRVITRIKDLEFHPGEIALVTGPSGSGKSTLFRAIAGIWPYGSGKIALPQGKSVMLLPQKPYIPLGTLRTALAYPGSPSDFAEAEIIGAMEKLGLSALIPRLDEQDLWARTLSGGEQQRVAIVRALLKKPDWLFLDEATAAMDEPLEAKVYQILREMLPNTTIVSIGHRATLLNFHNRRIDMKPNDDGTFSPVDTGAKAA
jgi:vitamin B12/bleomycin/antimicrobial peptide transport system ATP-binding/permease protein